MVRRAVTSTGSRWRRSAARYASGSRSTSSRDVLGERDHTHGVRDWTGIGNWIYYVVWFNERLAINPAAIVLDDGRISVGGFLWKDGVNTPIVGFRILDQQFRDGIIPVSSVLELTDKNGVKHILKGQSWARRAPPIRRRARQGLSPRPELRGVRARRRHGWLRDIRDAQGQRSSQGLRRACSTA